jgi:hypothetical protein
VQSTNVLFEKQWPKAQSRRGQVLDNKDAENQSAGGMGSPNPSHLLAFAGTSGCLFALLWGIAFCRMVAAAA